MPRNSVCPVYIAQTMDAFIREQIAGYGGKRHRVGALDMRKYPKLIRVRICGGQVALEMAMGPMLGRDAYIRTVVEQLLARHAVADTVFLVNMADGYTYLDDTPVFNYAVPGGKRGLVFPNFDLYVPRAKAAGGVMDFDQTKHECKQYSPDPDSVALDLYFKGNCTSKSRSAIRERLSREPHPFNVTASNDYSEPVFKIKDHKYALDLCGAKPQSLRLKYLFMMSRVVIRVSFFNPAIGETSHWRQWYDPIFEPGVDYVHLQYAFDYDAAIPDKIYAAVKRDVLAVRAHFEARPRAYAAMVASLDAKRRRLTLNSTFRYLRDLLERYTAEVLDAEP